MEETSEISKKASDYLNKLHSLYALSLLIKGCWISNDFEADERWQSVIKLSKDFESFVNSLSDSEHFESNDISFSAFSIFYYNDILLDIDNSNLKEIELLISDLILQRKFVMPFIFGRTLYNIFNSHDEWRNLEDLNPAQSEELLNSLPQGVYQVSNYLTGPFGLLTSHELRYIIPSHHLHLWHCSNVECKAFHQVLLHSASRSTLFAGTIYTEFNKRNIYRDDIHNKLKRIINERDSGFYHFYDIISFIGDALILKEKKALLKSILKSDSSREIVSSLARAGQDAIIRGNPDEIVENLDESSIMQLIFILKNIDIVKHIDNCIKKGLIEVETYENRVPKVTPPKFSSWSTRCEISSFGIRNQVHDPFINTVNIIWESYEGRIEELSWLMGVRDRIARKDDLVTFIRERQIEEVIQIIVMPNKLAFENVCRRSFYYPTANFNHEDIIREIGYKLGYTFVRFNQEFISLERRLGNFSQSIMQIGDISSESDRELIREAGVNLFVSLEEFLEELVTYNTWVASSDHVSKGFKYSKAAAQRSVVAVLGENITSGGAAFSWNENGHNTLGTSITYLHTLVNWLKERQHDNKSDYAKARSELPHYYEDKPEYVYLKYKQLWADAETYNLEEYIKSLEEVAKLIGLSALPLIRNGIDHKRKDDEFPTLEQLFRFNQNITKAIQESNRLRLLPKIYELTNIKYDRNRVETFEFSDYRGEKLYRYGPKFLRPSPAYVWGKPIIFAPAELLGHSHAYISFHPTEDTDFS